MAASACPSCQSPGRLVARVAPRVVVRCSRCGLVYVRPHRSAEELRQFYDWFYEQPSAMVLGAALQPAFAQFFEEVGDARRRVLDVGCGTGHFLRTATARGWHAEGLELSPRAITLGRAAGLQVHDAAATLPDAAFDVVTLWNVLAYVEAPLVQMAFVRRMLAPGGRLFIRDNNAAFHLAGDRLSRLAPSRALAGLLRGAHVWHSLLWSGKSLRDLLTRAGFRSVRVLNGRPTAGDPYGAVSPRRERLAHAAKRVVYATAEVARHASAGRLLLAPSIIALATRDAGDDGGRAAGAGDHRAAGAALMSHTAPSLT